MKPETTKNPMASLSHDNDSTTNVVRGGSEKNMIELNEISSISPPLEKTINVPSQLNYDDEVIFDSVSLHFSWSVFFVQFAAHIFIFLAPLLMPNMKAQGLNMSKLYETFKLQISTSALFYLAIISSFLSAEVNQRVLSGAFFIPCIYFIQHKLLVATKYATLSPTEYMRIMNVTDINLAAHYQSQLQLLTGWLTRDDLILEFEVNSACVRIGTKICDMYYCICNPLHCGSSLSQFRYWVAFMRGHKVVNICSKPPREFELVIVSEKDKDKADLQNLIAKAGGGANTKGSQEALSPFNLRRTNTTTIAGDNKTESDSEAADPAANVVPCSYYRISVFDICLTLLRRSDELARSMSAYWRFAIFLHSSINLLIPFIIMGIYYEKMDFSDIWLYVYISSSTIVSVLFGMMVHSLLYVSLFDVLRLLRIMRDLSLMARISDLELDITFTGDHDDGDDGDDGVDETKEVMGFSIKNTSSILHLNRKKKKVASASGSRKTDNLQKVSLSSTEDSTDFSTRSTSMSSFSMSSSNSMGSDDANNISKAGERMAHDSCIAQIPRLDFDSVENVISWTYTRLIFQNFGNRFRYRMDIYVGGTFAIVVLLLIASLVHTIMQTDRISALSDVFFLQSIVAITMVFIFMIIFTLVSSLINKETDVHSQLLARHILRLRTKRLAQAKKFGGSCEECERYDEIIEQIETSIETLAKERELKPFSVFGLEASDSLVATLLTSVSSFYFALIGLFGSTSEESTLLAF